MLIIKREKNENIERMLKRYKKKVDKTKLLKILRDKKQFIKPSEEKRKEKQKAIYIKKMYSDNNE